MGAYLELEDGTRFAGEPFGACTPCSGEVVFTTSMVGYPESLTDPSYRGQILCFTYPLIGNYGVPSDEKDAWGLPRYLESERVQVQGVLLAKSPGEPSHWNARRSLDAWLKEQGIPGLAGIDTRMLTKRLREKGVMLGRIVIDGQPRPAFDDPNARNLVAEVSCKGTTSYGEGDVTIVVLDCGVKASIIRELLRRDAKIVRVPWNGPLPERYDGLLISNGPGDPAVATESIALVQQAIKNEKPVFGVCLGNQLLALAAGGTTYKLTYGHRSHNQPCQDLETGACCVTSQNHGFAVKDIPGGFVSWWENVNDRTNEGIRHTRLPISSVQFHPEARGGPTDAAWLFDRFLRQVRR